MGKERLCVRTAKGSHLSWGLRKAERLSLEAQMEVNAISDFLCEAGRTLAKCLLMSVDGMEVSPPALVSLVWHLLWSR